MAMTFWNGMLHILGTLAKFHRGLSISVLFLEKNYKAEMLMVNNVFIVAGGMNGFAYLSG